MANSKKTITDINGVFASGLAAGIKSSGKRDLAFVYVPEAVSAAGVFTKNRFQAPCIPYNRQCLAAGGVKAVIINSGCANAATGRKGAADVRKTAKLAAEFLGLSPEQVVVSSTGIVGKHLPMDLMEKGIAKLLLNPFRREGTRAAEAILTTDLVKKEVFRSSRIGGETVSVAGIAKGSGMIAPNMATMLSYIVTDMHLGKREIAQLLTDAVDQSFNCMSVDTDTSCSDSVVMFSTGQKKVKLTPKIRAEFLNLLVSAAAELAKAVARDGEGATKLLEIRVGAARSAEQARGVALAVVNSPLFKAAMHGSDPNWGRIVVAAGKDRELGVDVDRLVVKLQGTEVFRRGEPLPFDRTKLHKLLKRSKEVVVELELKQGRESGKAWGCDLTRGYVDINTHYS
jgi:glutamate N-acetyltransferase/amino-acid N-acetyltransferase